MSGLGQSLVAHGPAFIGPPRPIQSSGRELRRKQQAYLDVASERRNWRENQLETKEKSEMGVLLLEVAGNPSCLVIFHRT